MATFAAIVPAGGRARRLGGVDKLQLPVHGRSLLERTLDALAEADPIVMVGQARPVEHAVIWTSEHPEGGGPLAALHAGLRWVPPERELVAVVAADHPYLTTKTVARLHDALAAEPDAAGAVLADAAERPQWLVGMWRVAALRAAMPTTVADQAVRAVLGPLEPLRVTASRTETADVDTESDLARARGLPG